MNILNAQGTHSPLHLAALKGFKLVVETLVEAGSNVNFTNKKGQTPMFSAVEGRVLLEF